MPSSDPIMSSFIRRVHFVGIGGVGMSGIAQVLLNLGYTVSGSDLKPTELTRRLAQAGARIRAGHRADHAAGAQVVVVSSAVTPSNPEVIEAKRRGIPVVARAQMLAELARLKKTVTVSGSHGKTTTTSMVALALHAAGADPTMVIGGQLKNIGANARLGLGEYLVAEADESDGSFLYMNPLVAVVTNIDTDHLDFYKSMANLRRAFLKHLHNLPFYGSAVLCADDPVLAGLFAKVGRPILSYGIDNNADWRAGDLELSTAGSKFSLYYRGRLAGRARTSRAGLRVPGRHNVLNALAAVAAGTFLGFDLKRLLEGLSEFRGVGRRLENLGEAGGVTFLDDYGHHPTEIRTTLEAVRTLYCLRAGDRPVRRRLVVVFQPHRYTRTKILHREFGPAFKAADVVYVTEIYPAGENPLAGVSSRLVLRSLDRAGAQALPFTRAVDLVRELKPGDVVLTLGAGDVWKIAEDLRRRLAGDALASY